GGDEQHLGTRAHQAAVELWKAQVVADREPERAELGGHRDRLGPGRARRRLAHRHAPRELDVEEVQLAIARDELAARADAAARVVGAWLAGRALEQRARTEMDREGAGERRQAPGEGPGEPLRDRRRPRARA